MDAESIALVCFAVAQLLQLAAYFIRGQYVTYLEESRDRWRDRYNDERERRRRNDA